jgi:putative AlgH/UPF0301 family transcriptional regulator
MNDYSLWMGYMEWARGQTGYVEVDDQWVTENLEHQRDWIFDTRENAEAFVAARNSSTIWQALQASYDAINVTQAIELTDI